METKKLEHGTINWHDLTVENADELKEFFKEVAGWQIQEIPMKNGDEAYHDYAMKDSKGNGVAGVCHAKGPNMGIPPQWMMYISVENINQSVEKALDNGGKLIKEYKSKEGILVYAIIEDPAGATFALAQI